MEMFKEIENKLELLIMFIQGDREKLRACQNNIDWYKQAQIEIKKIP